MNLLNVLWRGLVILALLCVMVGFGACGAWGAFGAVNLVFTPGESRVYGVMLLVAASIGLAIAWHSFKGIRAMLRGSANPRHSGHCPK